ncbi:MAG: hypothetical protein QW279_07475 [Candidatus Jordarchaeaceae archaeon]
MKTTQVDAVINKIEETQSLFKATAEVMPFIADLFQFLKDLVPLMIETNETILEGSKNLPTASLRIKDVNVTTEMATQTILDKLDVISARLEPLRNSLNKEQQKEIDEIQEEISHIIFALQFQDITSQKLDHANRILQAIGERFNNLFKRAEEIQTSSSVGSEIINDIRKECEKKKDKELSDGKLKDTVRDEGFTQEDIDQFFKNRK